MHPGWWRDNIHPGDRDNALATRLTAFASGQGSQEFRFRRADGEWRWVQENMYRPETRDYDLVGCWVDVTEEHALRTQLVQASKLATLGEMATAMAHELNQPLAVIITAVEGMLERCETGSGPTPEYLRAKLDRILKMTHRAATIINHMRVFGRVSGNEVRPVDWPAILEGALTILRPRLAMLEVQIDQSWPEALPPVLGEALQLEQVLINLLSNACDAFEENKIPTDRRRLLCSAAGRGGSVEMVVQDSAGGIPEAILLKIFQPFFTTKAPGKGTGLGLAISFGILRDLGGSLQVQNAPMPGGGQGARFAITLPSAEPAERQAA
jgi:C4-dicarboxylate-specific signal transduction histidine kinase